MRKNFLHPRRIAAVLSAYMKLSLRIATSYRLTAGTVPHMLIVPRVRNRSRLYGWVPKYTLPSTLSATATYCVLKTSCSRSGIIRIVDKILRAEHMWITGGGYGPVAESASVRLYGKWLKVDFGLINASQFFTG